MDQDGDELLGPIDYLIVEFPTGSTDFDGEMARELESLVEAEMIRVLDVLILSKDANHQVEALELDDLGDRGSLRALEGALAEVLTAEDVVHLAAAMEPESVAGVLVWENRWAGPFARAARTAGAQLIASGRIPTQAIIASFETAEGDR